MGTLYNYTGNFQRVYVRYYPSAWSTAPIGGATGVSAPTYYGSRTRRSLGPEVTRVRQGQPSYVGNYTGKGIQRLLFYSNTYVGGTYIKETDYVGNQENSYVGNYVSDSTENYTSTAALAGSAAKFWAISMNAWPTFIGSAMPRELSES